MSDDRLERASKALREEGGEPDAERAAQMRARIMSQSKRRAQLRPQGLYQWAAVICLGFFATTAMAHVIRVQLPKVLEVLRQEPAPAAPPPAPKSKKPARPKVAPVVVPDAGSGTPEVAAPEAAAPAPSEQVAPAPALAPAPTPAAPRPRRTKPVATRREPPRVAPTTPSVAPAPEPRGEREAAHAALPEVEPEPDLIPQPSAAPAHAQPLQPAAAPPKTTAESAELALFRRAQTLHLAHDKLAIEAWDAFLRVAPGSALAPEARYNRALGLIRAKRYSEAKDALAEFAEGKYGSYRKQEAKDLLARLPK
jgi:hypothetical protein